MSNYLEYIPEDLIGEICLYLSSHSLKIFNEVFDPKILSSRTFWFNKFDLEFHDFSWRLFIDLPIPIVFMDMNDIYFKMMKNRYNSIDDRLSVLIHFSESIVKNEIGIRSIKIINLIRMFTIDNKKKLESKLQEELEKIIVKNGYMMQYMFQSFIILRRNNILYH